MEEEGKYWTNTIHHTAKAGSGLRRWANDTILSYNRQLNPKMGLYLSISDMNQKTMCG